MREPGGSERWAAFGRGECPNGHIAGRNRSDDRCMRGPPVATGKELMLDQRARYGGEFIKRIEPWRDFLRESTHEGMQMAGSCVP